MSSLATVVRTVARTSGTPGAKATASITNATAEIVTAIFFNMTTTRCAASERANCVAAASLLRKCEPSVHQGLAELGEEQIFSENSPSPYTRVLYSGRSN